MPRHLTLVSLTTLALSVVPAAASSGDDPGDEAATAPSVGDTADTATPRSQLYLAATSDAGDHSDGSSAGRGR